MRIRNDILLRYLTEAAIDQIAEEYQKQGYIVERESALGDFRTDLTAKKDDELIVFEFKSGVWNRDKREAVKNLRNYVVRNFGAGFNLILVNPPGETLVEVEDIEQILHDLLLESCQSDLSELATHVQIDEVTDVEFDQVNIRKGKVELRGSASISLVLQYGSDSDVKQDMGFQTNESFPLNFHLVLDRSSTVSETLGFDLDVSSFYD